MSHSHARGELTSVRPPQLDCNFWKELNCVRPGRRFRMARAGRWKGGQFWFSLIKWRFINWQIEPIGYVCGSQIGGRSAAEAESPSCKYHTRKRAFQFCFASIRVHSKITDLKCSTYKIPRRALARRLIVKKGYGRFWPKTDTI